MKKSVNKLRTSKSTCINKKLVRN